MDEFGVDVQVLFPTWWLLYPVSSPAAEAAMYRSYNRWIAEGTADSGGRLQWAALAAGPTHGAGIRGSGLREGARRCPCSCSDERTG